MIRGGSARVWSRTQGVATCSEEVQWLSATAVRPHSTATNTTTPGCSGYGRAAEHDAFNGEGRDLTSYPRYGPDRAAGAGRPQKLHRRPSPRASAVCMGNHAGSPRVGSSPGLDELR